MRDLFKNSDFRRLFIGRLITNAGDSLYAVAAMWLVYSLTGSSTYTGLAGFLTMGPQVLQVFAGPLVDRFPIRRVLVASQGVQAVLVLTVPAAHLLGVLSVELVLVVMPLLSLLNQFVYPAQTAVLPRLVDDDQLTAANSAFSLAYQGTDMVFNALAGVLVALVGAVTLYAIDSVTFVIAVACFLGLRIPSSKDAQADGQRTDSSNGDAIVADGGEPAESSYLDDLRDGLRFIRHTPMIWFFGAGFVANGLLGATFAVLPAFADVHGAVGMYGFFLAGLSAGILVGAVVANRLDHVPYGRLSMGAFSFGAVAWVAAVASPWAPATVALFFLASVPIGVTNVIGATLVQRLVPDDLLGRVSAASGSASTAIFPLGALIGGMVGDLAGATAVMYAGGFGMLWIVVYVLAVPSLRTMPAANEVEPFERPAQLVAE
ncbi:MFS transporter [Haladaptatus sp. NG-SE-30]